MDALIKSIRIAGMQSTVPTTRHSFVETPDTYTQEEANKIYESTGIHSRRILDEALCVSDLCLFAAETLLNRLKWDAKSVDILIFVSQSADYPYPATACLMQTRLGLEETAACMDVNLGCSGFIYGLWIASKLLHGSNGKRALVLCGDTATRKTQENARPLFGDAGSATALEFDENWTDSYVVLGTDGTGGQHISMKAGGERFPILPDQLPESKSEMDQLILDSKLHLNGTAVFSFTLKVVAPLVQSVLKLARVQLDDIDMCVMHQANKFILEHLRKKLNIPQEKYIIDMEQFGNTSSASIPLAMCHQLTDFYTKTPKKTLMAGFGVGWSWGALIMDILPEVLFEVVEMPSDIVPLSLKQ